MVPGHATGPESGKQEGNVPAGENEPFQFVDNLCPEHEHTNPNVMDTTDTTIVVEPVVPGHGTGPESGKQEGNVPAARENEPLQFVGNFCPEHKCSSASVIDTTDTSEPGVVEPVLTVHGTNSESGQQEGSVPVVEVVQVEPPQSATKPLTTNR